MSRRLKIALAGCAVALAALVAATSAAAKVDFHATLGHYATTVTTANEGAHVISAEPGTVECEKVKSTTTTSEDEEQLKITPTYEGCTTKAFLFKSAATISMHECDYNFHTGSEVGGSGGKEFTGSLTIACPKGSSIEVQTGISGCDLTVSEQGPLKTVSYLDSGTTPSTVKVKLTASGIKYSVSSACETFGLKAASNGEYKGVSKAEGSSSGEAEGVEVVNAAGYFVGTSYPLKVEATGTHAVLLEDGKAEVKCGEATYKGELSAAAESLTLAPEYAKCTASIEGEEAAATVAMNGCEEEASALETAKESESLHAGIAIVPEGCGPMKIEVPSAHCSFEISSHRGFSGSFTETAEGTTGDATLRGVFITSNCPGTEAEVEGESPAHHFLYFVWLGAKLYFEWFPQDLTVPATTHFAANETRTVIVKNANWRPILAYRDNLTELGGLYEIKPGNCVSLTAMYFHNYECSIIVKNKGAGNETYKIRAPLFDRVVASAGLARP